MGAVGWMEGEDLREQAGAMKRSWQVRRVGAVDGHKCMNQNVVIYSELNQELLKDSVDVVGGVIMMPAAEIWTSSLREVTCMEAARKVRGRWIQMMLLE